MKRKRFIPESPQVGPLCRWLFCCLLLFPLGLSAEDYDLYVGGTQVTSANASGITFGEGTASFDASTNTLTLSGVTIEMANGGYAVETGSINNLTVHLEGYNSVTFATYVVDQGMFRYSGSAESATLTFTTEKPAVLEDYYNLGSLRATNLYSLSQFLIGYTFSDWTKDTEEMTETGWQYHANENSSEYGAYVGLQYVEVYDLWKGYQGSESFTRLTSSAMSENGWTYDPTTCTLDYGYYDTSMIFKSSMSELTVTLKGGAMHSILFEPKGDVTEGTLNFVMSSDEYTTDYSLELTEDITTFSKVNYGDGVMKISTESGYKIFGLAAPTVSYSYGEDDQDAFTISTDGYLEGMQYFYSIDYVDESLADVTDAEALVQTDGDGYQQVDPIAMAGPCVVTAYAKYNELTSPVATGKHFAFASSVIRVTDGETTSAQMPSLLPALSEEDGLEVSSNLNDENIGTISDGVVTFSGTIGETTISSNLSSNGETGPSYEILNNDWMLEDITLTVAPKTPTVELPAGTYNEAKEFAVSSTYESATIHYFRETDGEVDHDSITYDNTLRFDWTCTLHVYQEVSGVNSDTLALAYTVLPKTELNISFAENTREWATYCASERNLETPAGLQAYIVTAVNGTTLQVSPVGYIPQGAGVLLQRTEEVAEPLMVKAYLDEEEPLTDNLLSGTTETTSVSGLTGTVYVLYNGEFVRTSGTLPANRAYLSLTESAGARLMIDLDGGETTGLGEALHRKNDASADPVYDLQGRRVKHPTKGLYITNGKKIFIQ